MLHDPLCKAFVWNIIHSSVFTCNDAIDEPLQELRILLGIYGLCCLSRMPSTVHATITSAAIHRIGWICGKLYIFSAYESLLAKD